MTGAEFKAMKEKVLHLQVFFSVQYVSHGMRYMSHGMRYMSHGMRYMSHCSFFLSSVCVTPHEIHCCKTDCCFIDE